MDDPQHNPSIHDSTHDDHERFERRQLARDGDSEPSTLVTVDESKAAQRVRALREEGVVDAIPEEKRLVHQPSEKVFRSDRALVLFHHGWVTARDDQ
jgi:hypothetical protein